MKINLNKNKLKVIIALSIIFVSVIGASYAYFTSVSENAASSNVVTTTSGRDAFSTSGNGLISLYVSAHDMEANQGNNDYSKYVSASANIGVSLTAGGGNATCTYDLFYTASTPFTASASAGSLKEFTLSGTDGTQNLEEINLAGYGTSATKLNSTSYTINTTSTLTQNWVFTARFYNLGVNQDENSNKTFGGNITVGNVSCTNSDEVVASTDPITVNSGDIAVSYDKNLIPIMYATTCPQDAAKDSTNGCWVKADTSNTDANYSWFDYTNHKWANAVTVTTSTLSTYKSASVGTPVLYADTMGYFVYIPRYLYRLFNVNADGGTYVSAQEILINFENKNKSKSPGSTNSTYFTHPAFTFGTTELNGFWIGKFETSYGTDNTSAITSATALAAGVTVKPSTSTTTMYSLRSMRISKLYTIMKSLSNGGGQAASNHNLSSLESSMLTNMEWGAAAYLTESVYGTCTGTKGSAVCTAQPQINSVGSTSTNGAEQTGCGPQSAGSTSSGTTCNYYNTTLGKLASTTQNIYGVYDMNGGAYEYTMGVTYDTAGTTPNYLASGFTAGTMPDTKYYDLYTYGTTNTNAAAYTRGKLGDATKEVVKASGSTWYGSYAGFPRDGVSWFVRGGVFAGGSYVGVLYFNSSNGDANFGIS